jgi:uncharacterized protein (DUF2237 family)
MSLPDRENQLNVFDEKLQPAGFEPLTGFFRDGYCRTSAQDYGSHTVGASKFLRHRLKTHLDVAAVVNKDFLNFSKQRGNDLTSILSPSCSWCLCAARWKEAFDAFTRGEHGKEIVPLVNLAATNKFALKTVSLEDLKRFDAGPLHKVPSG